MHQNNKHVLIYIRRWLEWKCFEEHIRKRENKYLKIMKHLTITFVLVRQLLFLFARVLSILMIYMSPKHNLRREKVWLKRIILHVNSKTDWNWSSVSDSIQKILRVIWTEPISDTCISDLHVTAIFRIYSQYRFILTFFLQCLYLLFRCCLDHFERNSCTSSRLKISNMF